MLFPQPGILSFPCQLFSFSLWNAAEILAPWQSFGLHSELLKTCAMMLNYLLTDLVIFLSLAIDYKFSWMEILFCSFLFPQYQVVCQESINNFINISWWITNTLPKVSIQEVCQCQQFPSRLVKNLFHLPSVQFSHSVVSDLATPWTAAWQASLSITNSWSLLKLMSVKSVMPSSHLILCRPLLLLSSIFPSIRLFSNESVLHIRWPKYWCFSFYHSPSNEYSGLISFRIDWFDLLAVQGTLNSLLQHHSSKALFLWCSALFTIQISHPNTTTGKTIALTRPLSVK